MLLRDADGDGVAETRTVFLQGLHSPFGIALVDGDLYVADTDAVLHFPYVNGETTISENGTKLADRPQVRSITIGLRTFSPDATAPSYMSVWARTAV